jgi:DNA-directed RNA polymerase sigma subunit (sigma70/sigma32)
MTLEKIGKKFDVTREAVRQSIKTALNKIRSLV